MALTNTIIRAAETVAEQTFTVTETTKTVKGQKVTTRAAEPSAEMLDLIRYAARLNDQQKAAEAKAKQVKAMIAERMEAQGIDQFTHEGKVRASRSVVVAERIDTARLKADYPDLAADLTYQSEPSTRLTVK